MKLRRSFEKLSPLACLCLLAALLADTPPLAAAPQGDSASAETPETMTSRIELVHARPDALLSVLELFAVEVETESSALVLSGSRREVEAAVEVIARLDQPDPDSLTVELEVHLVAGHPEPGPTALPQPVKEALDELEIASAYLSFELLDTLVVTIASGEAGELEGLLPSAASEPARYELKVEETKPLPGGSRRIVRLRGFSFTLFDVVADAELPEGAEGRLPTAWASLETDVEVPSGELVAIGKAATLDASDALFLVIEVGLLEGSKNRNRG